MLSLFQGVFLKCRLKCRLFFQRKQMAGKDEGDRKNSPRGPTHRGLQVCQKVRGLHCPMLLFSCALPPALASVWNLHRADGQSTTNSSKITTPGALRLRPSWYLADLPSPRFGWLWASRVPKSHVVTLGCWLDICTWILAVSDWRLRFVLLS